MTVERFDCAGFGKKPGVVLLHGSDGLTRSGLYEAAARTLASAGFTVFLPHYFEVSGDRRAAYSELQIKFPIWLDAIEDALDEIIADSAVAQNRIGVVGISLGGALALALSARDARIKAVVNYFGYLPEPIQQARRFAPTLILHGDADRVIPVSNAYAIERLLKARGTVVESQIYPGQGHGFEGGALSDAASRTATFLRRYLSAG